MMPEIPNGQERLALSEAPGRGETILVVDDSLAWLRFAREILTAGGCQAQTCEDPLRLQHSL